MDGFILQMQQLRSHILVLSGCLNHVDTSQYRSCSFISCCAIVKEGYISMAVITSQSKKQSRLSITCYTRSERERLAISCKIDDISVDGD